MFLLGVSISSTVALSVGVVNRKVNRFSFGITFIKVVPF